MVLSFNQAVQRVNATGRPVVEGFAVQLRSKKRKTLPRSVKAVVEGRSGGWKVKGSWNVVALGDGKGWWTLRNDAARSEMTPAGAWDVVRELVHEKDVANAEPLLVNKLPVTTGAAARQHFQMWGKASEERLADIQVASRPVHWSLIELGVCDSDGKGGAWKLWADEWGDSKQPGEGVLIAHPDTGYSRHTRLTPHLEPQSEGSDRYGKNFVERDAVDGLDPLKDRSFGHNPGHGTKTASVIVAGGQADDQPWGVAPGARLLPLRVSSSVIHLSFANLCEAFKEAIDQEADVISMSLGGPVGSRPLASLVRKALDQGIIVVAAAGNKLPTVVFPARLPGVIACAASNAVRRPWRFSGLGSQVDVTAPGELVWHDRTQLEGGDQKDDSPMNGSGTSYATANVAGLAALWLSYHGGREELIKNKCNGQAGLLPVLFLECLKASCTGKQLAFVLGGGFGKGIVNAEKLLQAKLLSVQALRKRRKKLLSNVRDHLVDIPKSNWWTILTLPTLAAEKPKEGPNERQAAEEALDRLLDGVNGLATALGKGLDAEDRAELVQLAGSDVRLAQVFARAIQRPGSVSSAALRRYLLRDIAGDRVGDRLSEALVGKLKQARQAAIRKWQKAHPELSNGRGSAKPFGLDYAPDPRVRRLRAYAFDPSLATRSAYAEVNEITIEIDFEHDLKPGPVGEYLEVVDVDPPSDCVYTPVDLNHPSLLAQDGLDRSESNPQFHQQMVYGVAMKTIEHFERALGRPIFWSPLRIRDKDSGDHQRGEPFDWADESYKEWAQEVPRLRIYPHALRSQNAFYSPQKRAILFGYFPAGDTDPGNEFPGGVVFTCLAHDIIAHEMTHAILDGMHPYFTQASNPDVLPFHEAFADLVALFQRFTYPDLLRDQIAEARGRLGAGTLMTRLALQFGRATGHGQALRDALGIVLRQYRRRQSNEWRNVAPEEGRGASLEDTVRDLGDDEWRHVWRRFQADPLLLDHVEEVHDRGSILVAAVFDAYLRIYEDRIADLERIATGGSGQLPDGELHPDLVMRMAQEASKAAGHVLRMCIRAMDYVPPVDITFGEFLRALITADYELVPSDERRYRVAFIEAFRKWGIYPRDVRILSEESLRWSRPGQKLDDALRNANEVKAILKDALKRPGQSRRETFCSMLDFQADLHGALEEATDLLRMLGIDPQKKFEVTNLRPTNRIGPDGEHRTVLVVEIVQHRPSVDHDDPTLRRQHFRGGATLIFNSEALPLYVIYKRADDGAREARQREHELRAGGSGGHGAAEYSTEGLPAGWFSRPELREAWQQGRGELLENMRASSCGCRRSRLLAKKEKAGKKARSRFALALEEMEPFALLHQR